MTRHLVAVCVVCLICAKHLPCKQHFDNIIVTDPNAHQVLTLNISTTTEKITPNQLPGQDSALYHSVPLTLPNKRRGRTKDIELSTEHPLQHELETNYLRAKRHVHHNTVNVNQLPDKSLNNEYVKRLFREYGDEETLTMNFIGFEKMLKKLGLLSLLVDEEQQQQMPVEQSNNSSSITNDTCISTIDLITRVSTSERNHYKTNLMTNGHNHTQSTTDNTDTSNKNINKTSIKEHLFINSNDLCILCPMLLYKLTARTSTERLECIKNSFITSAWNNGAEYYHHNHHDDSVEDKWLVWTYSLLSILGISLCGLLGVAVIPFMDKQYYHHIIQFLVALAVGTLAGDALLHLLPHAMLTFNELDDPHLSMTFKGLVASFAIVFFFITERALTMIAEWRKRIEKKDKPSSRVRVMRDPVTKLSIDKPSMDTSEKLCKHKYSSYPYCYDEIAMDTKDDHHHHHHKENIIADVSDNNIDTTTASSATNKLTTTTTDLDVTSSGNGDGTIEIILRDNYNLNKKETYKKIHDNNLDYVETVENLLLNENNKKMENVDNLPIKLNGHQNEKDSSAMPEESYTIILREHEAKHHGHSHTHGHVHSPPSSLSAVAWMVVMGDGLHNFTDGMAIGAAFSNNIAGGFSTAIAVFCHELPHELGDFAVLLKAGMSAKQAVYYNVLSSVLSFFGTILGVLIGDTPEASAWIFAGAAGMFIYIALVDMMPELTTSHKDRFPVSQLLLQILGISLGIGIMLLIAIYEDKLKSIFTSSEHNHSH